MTIRRLSVTVAAVLAIASLAVAAPQMGRYGILPDAHGYNAGGTVLLPLRAIGEWLGAEVAFKSGLITIRDGERAVSLRIGASTATVDCKIVKLAHPAQIYGDITCVPLRFVAEALDCRVEYVSGMDQVEYLSYIPHVVITRGNSKATVIVHGVSPDLVAGILAAEAATRPDEQFGWDYLLRVSRVKGNWTSAWVPWWFDDEWGFSFKAHAAIYERVGSRWIRRFATTRVSDTAEDYTEAGVPLSVVREFGYEIEEPYR
jgi:hypothetical protein